MQMTRSSRWAIALAALATQVVIGPAQASRMPWQPDEAAFALAGALPPAEYSVSQRMHIASDPLATFRFLERALQAAYLGQKSMRPLDLARGATPLNVAMNDLLGLVQEDPGGSWAGVYERHGRYVCYASMISTAGTLDDRLRDYASADGLQFGGPISRFLATVAAEPSALLLSRRSAAA